MTVVRFHCVLVPFVVFCLLQPDYVGDVLEINVDFERRSYFLFQIYVNLKNILSQVSLLGSSLLDEFRVLLRILR